ncbi:hypothetical protein LSCM4_06812 [Leishmania orientalis]|uniref:Uncharacterized protein n=1 Tax=Leishmania orientalis TaxID=2249476 RepID=A0A836H587_9TRYP|nr:hypothetical protein LSCM4_06812 [Leishmania orientalis]
MSVNKASHYNSCAMNSREASRAAANRASASSSAPPQRRPPDTVAVPAPMQRFYTHFMAVLTQQTHRGPGAAVSTPLVLSQHRSTSTIDGQGGTGDEGLHRLTCAQEEALGPLLWQWLALFSLAVERAGDALRERGPATPAVRSMPSPHILGPYDVERLFHTGFSSLPPVAATARQLPTSDPPTPWHTAPLADHKQSERTLVAALSALSRNGPLFSAWCSLCYTCVGDSLVTSTSQDSREEGHVAVEPSKSNFFVAEEATRSALRSLRRAWDSAVALSGAAAGDSSPPDTLAVRTSVDVCATVRLWTTVYKTCATSCSAVAVAPVAHEKDTGSGEPQAPPLSLSLWAAQWYRECTRVAAYGADEGFHAEEAGVPVELVTRVMRYMCHRLDAEVAKCAKRRDRSGTATSLTAAVERKEVHAEIAAPLSSQLHSNSYASAPLVATLRVGTLAALALESPMHLVGNCVDRRGGAAKRSGGRKGGAPLRRQRRAWHLSDDEDDSDDDDSVEDPDYGSGRERSWRGHTGAQAGGSRLIGGQQEQFAVPIASGVLTTYSMSPADDDLAQPTGHLYTPRLTGEKYLRNGTVHWWTLCDSQRHRQLLSEGRTTSS